MRRTGCACSGIYNDVCTADKKGMDYYLGHNAGVDAHINHVMHVEI